MSALIRPILIEQGATLTIQTQVSSAGGALPLTGYSAKFEVKRPHFPPVLTLETGSGIMFQADGMVIVTATPAQTKLLPALPGRRYDYGLFLKSPTGVVYALIAGRAVVRSGLLSEFTAPVGEIPMAVAEAPMATADYSWITSIEEPLV